MRAHLLCCLSECSLCILVLYVSPSSHVVLCWSKYGSLCLLCLTSPFPPCSPFPLRLSILSRLSILYVKTFDFRGRRLEVIDTAGLTRRAGQQPPTANAVGGRALLALEEAAYQQAYNSMHFAQVTLVVVDAKEVVDAVDPKSTKGEYRPPLTRTELSLVADAVVEGRSLVIVANKVDKVLDTHRYVGGGGTGGDRGGSFPRNTTDVTVLRYQVW